MAGLARVRLLIIDDSLPFRATLVGWAAVHDDLELVAAVGSAEEGLALVWSERPDVVVIDRALRGMSGPDAVRALRRAGARIPIVMITLHDTALGREQAASAGATAFLAKHAVAEQLHPLLRELVRPRDAPGQTGTFAAVEHEQRLAVATVVSAAMSHEINNALAVVTSGLSFLAEYMGPGARQSPHADEILEALDETKIAVEHIAGVVSDVQVLLRGERRTVLVDPRVAVERALRMARPRAGAVALSAELEDVPTVWASEAAITQVVLNLVLNALAACRSCKRAGHVRVTLAHAREAVVLAVHDDGPGLDRALIAAIWQPLRASTAGSGLGLPVTRGLVAAMGGTIDVESRPTRRTTFRVVLPVAAAAS